MSSNIRNEDLRSMRTEKALYSAMLALLKRSGFRKISIKEICEEALISRATFYAHYNDKYDLLKHWIAEFWTQGIGSGSSYEQIEKLANCHIHENMQVLKNLVFEADNETYDIMFDYILSTINLDTEKISNDEMNLKNVVLSNFYAGGIMSYLSWHVNNKFPPDVPPVNKYFYEMIRALQDWQLK